MTTCSDNVSSCLHSTVLVHVVCAKVFVPSFHVLCPCRCIDGQILGVGGVGVQKFGDALSGRTITCEGKGTCAGLVNGSTFAQIEMKVKILVVMEREEQLVFPQL